jgi:hypothetical protein
VFICMVVATIAVVPPVAAQSDEFEVASIRRSATNIGPWSTQHPSDGRFSGQNDFKLTWTPSQVADLTGPSIFTAIQEQYGLRLVVTKGPVSDHARSRAAAKPATERRYSG